MKLYDIFESIWSSVMYDHKYIHMYLGQYKILIKSSYADILTALLFKYL